MSEVPNHATSFDRDEGTVPSGRIAQKTLVTAGAAPASALQVDFQLAGLPCVLYQCGLDLIVSAISPNASELIGIRPESILGKRALWQERLLPADRIRLYSKLEHLAQSETASETHRINNDQGLLVWVSHSFRKWSCDGETIIRGCIVPLATADLACALDAGLIHQFVHRIGNHFQLIHLLIDSLRRKVSNLDEYEELQKTVDRAVEFTRSFLRYSQSPVLNASVEIGELLRSLIQSWAPHFNENNVAVESLFHQSLDVASVIADPVLLEAAFGSVLQNALDATKHGDRLVIDGRTERLGTGGGSIARIVITDSGKGMAKEEVAKAAVPFTTTKRDGDGLGLSSAVRTIEMHGGVVTISSEPGRGTKVEIVLPVHSVAGCSVR